MVCHVGTVGRKKLGVARQKGRTAKNSNGSLKWARGWGVASNPIRLVGRSAEETWPVASSTASTRVRWIDDDCGSMVDFADTYK